MCLIVVHGTSQDILSVDETTVKIVKAARAHGRTVIELGGPGSTDRTVRMSERLSPTRPLWERTIEEIGEVPIDYPVLMGLGTAFGTGFEDLVKEVIDVFGLLLSQRHKKIELVGFSRGAVVIARALERIAEIFPQQALNSVTVNAALLDPVPGPYFVPQSVTIPSFVNKLFHRISKHEGRPGFLPLIVFVGKGVKYQGDIVMGVHGDIGGSTRRDVPRLILDEVAEFVRLPSLRLSPDERLMRGLRVISDTTPYTNPGPMQWMQRRGLGFSDVEIREPEIVQFPSNRVFRDFDSGIDRVMRILEAQRARLEAERRREEFRQHWARLREQRQERNRLRRARRIIVPELPIVGQGGQVRIPPATQRSMGLLFKALGMVVFKKPM